MYILRDLSTTGTPEIGKDELKANNKKQADVHSDTKAKAKQGRIRGWQVGSDSEPMYCHLIVIQLLGSLLVAFILHEDRLR